MLAESEGRDKMSIRLHKYVGESCRSSYERGSEHWNDAMNLNEGSHMLKHHLQCHEGESLDKIDFSMRVIRYHKTPFARQIHEAVAIQQNRLSHNILNSRSEFNRCAIPRLSLKIGDKDLAHQSRAVAEAKLREDLLEGKIKLMKRERNKVEGKKRAPSRPGEMNKRKRIRLGSQTGDEMNSQEISEINIRGAKAPDEPTTTLEKRKLENIEVLTENAKRQRLDFESYFKSMKSEGNTLGINKYGVKMRIECPGGEVHNDLCVGKDGPGARHGLSDDTGIGGVVLCAGQGGAEAGHVVEDDTGIGGGVTHNTLCAGLGVDDDTVLDGGVIHDDLCAGQGGAEAGHVVEDDTWLGGGVTHNVLCAGQGVDDDTVLGGGVIHDVLCARQGGAEAGSLVEDDTGFGVGVNHDVVCAGQGVHDDTVLGCGVIHDVLYAGQGGAEAGHVVEDDTGLGGGVTHDVLCAGQIVDDDTVLDVLCAG